VRVPEPLTDAAFHILLALADRDRHGYEIMQHIDREPGMAGRVGTTTLYRTIRSLLGLGLVVESERRAADGDDQRRRYYHLTTEGRRAAQAEIERLRQRLAAAEATTLARRPARPAGATRLAQ
jgi:DNA-binding PadR family transcriptional regulator